MNKKIRYLTILLLVLTIVGVARNNPAWAGSLPTSNQPSGIMLPNTEITITDSGLYTIGGLCTLEVNYKGEDLKNRAAIDVPVEDSRQVPFAYEGDLYLAGCHIEHYKDGKLVQEARSADGNWEVCFGDRPDEKLKIYYYLDQPFTEDPAWMPLPSTIRDGFVCAPALSTGVYAPAGVLIPQTGDETGGEGQIVQSRAGTVQPPAPQALITRSGRYSIGGVCSIIVDYYVSGLSNEVHVEENIETSYNVPFPDNEGLLYLPGCHVYHYKRGDLVDDVTTEEGRWIICFAAIPDRQTTIYFYYAKDDIGPVTSVWEPLDTTVEDGLACAPLTNFTGVYTPTGK